MKCQILFSGKKNWKKKKKKKKKNSKCRLPKILPSILSVKSVWVNITFPSSRSPLCKYPDSYLRLYEELGYLCGFCILYLEDQTPVVRHISRYLPDTISYFYRLHNNFQAHKLKRKSKETCYRHGHRDSCSYTHSSKYILYHKLSKLPWAKVTKNSSMAFSVLEIYLWWLILLAGVVCTLKYDPKSRPRWLSWMRRPTGDQEVAGSTPAEVGNILWWRVIMKYFLRSFSPFRWFKKGSCQFLAKECAQYWLTA